VVIFKRKEKKQIWFQLQVQQLHNLTDIWCYTRTNKPNQILNQPSWWPIQIMI